MNLNSLKAEFLEGKLDKPTYIDRMFEIHSILFDYAAFIESTNISKIEIEKGEVVMTFRDSGVKFICAPGDKRLAPFDAINFRNYEEAELLMQLRLIEENTNVLDIGGNFGWYAIHIGKRIPNVNIHSFEPVPQTYGYLKKNIAVNSLSNIQAYNFGLSDSKGSFDLYYDPELSVNASLQNVSGKGNVKTVPCKIETLDNFCIENKVKVDFIKCDVEGAELLAFKGGIKTIQRDLPVIFSEMLRKWTAKFNYHPNDIINFLSDLGYQCYTLHNDKLKILPEVNEETVETNYFFLHKDKHIDKIRKHSLKI